MFNIDKYVEDIRRNKINITFRDIEEIGIRKPGHIFRLLLKLQVDAGKIDNIIYNYIIEKFNTNTMVTNNNINGVINQGNNDIHCCSLNCFASNNCGNRRNINNSNTFNEFMNYYEPNQNKLNESEFDGEDNILNYIDIFTFLKNNNLWRYKENFIHNGFDQIEYVLLQLFSPYTYNKSILNDYLHLYLDEDKNIVLKVLYNEKKKLSLKLGYRYNDDELNLLLLSKSTNSENMNSNYISSVLGTGNNNMNNDNNKSCCSIF